MYCTKTQDLLQNQIRFVFHLIIFLHILNPGSNLFAIFCICGESIGKISALLFILFCFSITL